MLKGFEGDGGNFKCDSLSDRKPVKFMKSRCNMMVSMNVGKNNPSK